MATAPGPALPAPRRRLGWFGALLVAVIVVAVVLLAVRQRGPGGRLGDLPYFPGTALVGTTASTAALFGFPEASWDQVELRSQAPYDRVREFYAKVAVAGWTSTFESELPKSDGRVYTRLLADNRRKEFYVITVEERQASRDVVVVLRRGVAR